MFTREPRTLLVAGIAVALLMMVIGISASGSGSQAAGGRWRKSPGRA